MTRYVIDEQGQVFLLDENGDVVRAENLRTGEICTGNTCNHPDRIIVPDLQPIQQTSDLRFWSSIFAACCIGLVPVFVAAAILLRVMFP